MTDNVVVAAPWRLKTAANGVTVARLAATPLLVLIMVRSTPSWGTVCFWAVLAFSDFADGWLARRRGPSASGAFLDPLADKFLVLGALAALVGLGDVGFLPVVLLAGREVVITTYRVMVAKRGVSVPARRVAKMKTLVEFFAIGLVLLPVGGTSRLGLAHAVLWLAVVLAWVSAVQYLADSRPGRPTSAPVSCRSAAWTAKYWPSVPSCCWARWSTPTRRGSATGWPPPASVATCRPRLATTTPG